MTVHIPIWLVIAVSVAAYLFVAYCLLGFFGIVAHCQRKEIDTNKLIRRAESGRMFLDAAVWPWTLLRTAGVWYDAPMCAIYYCVLARKSKRKRYRTPHQAI